MGVMSKLGALSTGFAKGIAVGMAFFFGLPTMVFIFWTLFSHLGDHPSASGMDDVGSCGSANCSGDIQNFEDVEKLVRSWGTPKGESQ
jgi:hypothetical protein